MRVADDLDQEVDEFGPVVRLLADAGHDRLGPAARIAGDPRLEWSANGAGRRCFDAVLSKLHAQRMVAREHGDPENPACVGA